MAGKLRLVEGPARPVRAGRARLLQVCRESGLSQAEMGELVGTTDRGVRRLLRPHRKRADRLDLLVALEQRGKKAA